MTTTKPKTLTFPTAPKDVVIALREHIEAELQARLPADVWQLVSDLEWMNNDTNNVGMADFAQYVDDLFKAQWYWANGETSKEYEARIKAKEKAAMAAAEKDGRK